MDLEFSPEEVQGLMDMASDLVVTESEIRGIYAGLIERAAKGTGQPDSSFMMRFVRRPSFMCKSSYREKLLTLLGAVKNSVAWTNGVPERSKHLMRTAWKPSREKAIN